MPSLEVVGNDRPSSPRSPPISVGSSNGLRNAIKLLSRNIPNPYATMKYPCIRYIRRKKSSNVILNNIQRGTTWIVDLSSQYCTARRTKTGMFHHGVVIFWKVGKVE